MRRPLHRQLVANVGLAHTGCVPAGCEACGWMGGKPERARSPGLLARSSPRRVFLTPDGQPRRPCRQPHKSAFGSFFAFSGIRVIRENLLD